MAGRAGDVRQGVPPCLSCAVEPGYSNIPPKGICNGRAGVASPLSCSPGVFWGACWGPLAPGGGWGACLRSQPPSSSIPLEHPQGRSGGWWASRLRSPLPTPAFALHRCSRHPAPVILIFLTSEFAAEAGQHLLKMYFFFFFFSF